MSEMKPTAIIQLSRGYVSIVDADDAEELGKYKWHYCNGYAKRSETINGKSKAVAMHRQLMNPPDGMVVDHIDGNRLNNQRSNLRICTAKENAQNRKKRKPTADKYKGVRRRYNRYEASINSNGKNIYLGSFLTAEDAAHAYDHAAQKLHGRFAALNGIHGAPSPVHLENEARNVLKSTGLSPVQLVEMVKELKEALTGAQQAINSMKVEAETAAQGDEQMMLEACETISNEGLDADMAIRAALAKCEGVGNE